MKQELLKKLEHKNLNEIESFLPGNDYIRGYCGNINGYYTKVDPSKLGHALRALITVRAFMGRLKPFLHKIKTYKEVVNCYRITGNENIVMEVILKDQKHLEQFIDELITYGETKTQIILSNVVSNKEFNLA